MKLYTVVFKLNGSEEWKEYHNTLNAEYAEKMKQSIIRRSTNQHGECSVEAKIVVS